MVAPSIAVGAGGKKYGNEQKDDSLTEEVGRMVDEKGDEDQGNGRDQNKDGVDGSGAGGADGETVLRERRADEKPNPKKRMFEELPAGGKVRDEL